MPRFYFDLHAEADDLSYKDEIGEELSDAQAAWQEAVMTAGQTMKDISRTLRPGSTWRLEVKDSNGQRLFAIVITTEGE